MDPHPITTYDSVTWQKEPRAPWIAENLAPDHWERYTQLLRSWQQTFKEEPTGLQRHYNHSGVMATDKHPPSLTASQEKGPRLPQANVAHIAHTLCSLWQNPENQVARFQWPPSPCGSSTLSFYENPLSLVPIFLSHWHPTIFSLIVLNFPILGLIF